jgi:deoxyribonuclease IV
MLLGVHCSVSGGLENAFTEAEALGIDTMQIFTRNQRQWKAKPISEEEQAAYLTASKGSRVKVGFSHCSYLINLAAQDDAIREKSIAALTEELIRCTKLGLAYCVLHPGAAGAQSPETAMDKIAEGLRIALNETIDSDVMVLLENTAGQGSSVGGPFENLRYITQKVKSKRIGYCFDTCHAFAAGFDIRTESGMKETMQKFDEVLGLENLKVFHLNDSKGDLGSHLDRHEHIGHGKLGLDPFRYIMNHFQNIPKVIETEKEGDWDNKNLETLKSLVKK